MINSSMKNLSKIWEDALVEIEKIVSPANFSTWFKGTTILREEGGVIYIGIPNSFTLDWVQKKFHTTILEVLKGIYVMTSDLKYVNMNNGEISSYVKRVQPESYLAILNTKVDDLDEKSESLLTRLVFLAGRTESLIGKVNNVLSQVSKLTSSAAIK